MRGPQMMVGVLGILKAGGAYVPLDPTYPAGRLNAMLEDSCARLVVTDTAPSSSIRGLSGDLLCLDTDALLLETQSEEDPAPSAGMRDLAYVIFTSGSTGRPKGAMIEHRSAVNYLWWAIHYYKAHEGSGSPVHTTLSFDLTVTSLFCPLLAGKAVTLVPRANETEALAQALGGHQAFSLVKLTPAHVDILRHMMTPQQAAGCAGAFVIGGEALLNESLVFWHKHSPQTRLINEYGPTETTVGCCIYESRPDDRGPCVPIGRPIANTQLYVLDANLQPVPIGVIGELYIGGIGVGRGYLNRPDLTAERFINNPFSDRLGATLYRSGDLVRYRRDGILEYLGRADQQVKIRGYRIEPGEVEAVLLQQPHVRDAAVSVHVDASGTKRLIGYITAQNGAALSIATIRDSLQQLLPEYMLPSDLIVLNSLPLTPNDKVDRAALPPPVASRDRAGGEYVAPADLTERLLANIFQEILHVPLVGATDDFFRLGGDSMQAVNLLVRLERETAGRLSMNALVESPSVRSLAARLAVPTTEDRPGVPLVLQRGGDHRPVFYLPGAGGHCLEFCRVIQHLSSMQPVYGLQQPGLGDDGQTPTKIEDIAASFVRQVRGVQPRGPYQLVGFSLGGVIAFEMARQLRESGDEVSLLALLDSWGTDYPRYAKTLAGKIAWRVRNSAKLSPGQLTRHLRGSLSNKYSWLKQRLIQHDAAASRRIVADVGKSSTRPCPQYHPLCYDGPVLLFRAELGVPWLGASFADRTNGWESVAVGGLRVFRHKCSHLELLEDPFAQEVAAQLNQFLDQFLELDKTHQAA